MSKHEIASSSAHGARCTCGHIERSAEGRAAALNQMLDHMESPDPEEAAQSALASAWEAGWEANTAWSIYIDMAGDEPDCSNPYRTAL